MEKPSSPERSPEGRSNKQEKEQEACGRVCREAGALFERAEERARSERYCTPADRKSTKRFPVESAADHMVAVSQREHEEVERFLESVRERGQYYEEKAASKLKRFLKREEDLLRSLAEIETHYPALAELLKERKPYLKKKMQDADRSWKEEKEQ